MLLIFKKICDIKLIFTSSRLCFTLFMLFFRIENTAFRNEIHWNVIKVENKILCGEFECIVVCSAYFCHLRTLIIYC